MIQIIKEACEISDHDVNRGSRLDEIKAAILDVKLRNLDTDTARRREIAKYYIENNSKGLII
mgnify:CR=1 FL=1